MILQALYDYYQRKSSDPASGIAPEGFEWKEIPFIVVIDYDGNFIRLEDTRTIEGKIKRAKSFLVPASVSRSAGIKPNFLWDNATYTLGVPGIKKADKKAAAKLAAFIDVLEKSTLKDTKEIVALVKFLKSDPMQKISESLKENETWLEVQEVVPNVTFSFNGESEKEPVCSRFNDVIKDSLKETPSTENVGTCLITGDNKPLARLHTLISGFPGAQSAGAGIVSFNNKSFCSYGKDQSFNAPVSESAMFAYTTALKMMLGKDSKNKLRIGETSVIFWSDKKTEFEENFPFFFGYEKDNPDADIRAVKQLYDSVYTGASVPNSDAKFFVLGLSPNAARLSVRFWHAGCISDFSSKIKQHFDDLEIIRDSKDEGKYALFWLLSAISLEGKTDNLPPILVGRLMDAIFKGSPYPELLLNQTLSRIRADRNISRIRAGILKAYLNRKQRIYNNEDKEITVALDTTNTNEGYLLGRLFAVLEKLQERAQSNINATIKDRYYGAASSTPITVFPQLLKLKVHHLAKIDNQGVKVFYEKKIGEIIELLPPSMPSHMNLENQAKFAIGYYHQRQDFFNNKETENN